MTSQVTTAVIARVTDLTVTFAGQPQPAVDRVSLDVRAGECVALVGESGSGKSLTAKALLGLLPCTARSSGQIEVLNAQATLDAAPPPHSSDWNSVRGLQLGLVPQDALGALDPLRLVEHEVGDSVRLHRLAPRRERRKQVVAALTAAAMPEPERRLRQRSDELSGGLRQRALVASALIASPTFIVADEPTTALDANHRGRVLHELRERVRARAGVLLITHDLESVRGIADRVYVMRHGQVIEAGTPERVLGAPQHPFTQELLDASPQGKRRTRREELGVSPGSTDQPPRLKITGVRVGFGRGSTRHEVLRESSLTVVAGETVGLVGESGSGKTTLLRVALGLQAPDSGTVEIDGIDRAAATRAQRRELRKRIGLVPQDPLSTFPPGATGTAIVQDALRAAGVPRAQRRQRALDLVEEVRLSSDELVRPAATLSGGQRQRLAIARALARDPELLLLDEPVSALDLTVQARVLELLNELQDRRGTSYLLVSHDEAVIRFMSDRVLRIEDGVVGAP